MPRPDDDGKQQVNADLCAKCIDPNQSGDSGGHILAVRGPPENDAAEHPATLPALMSRVTSEV